MNSDNLLRIAELRKTILRLDGHTCSGPGCPDCAEEMAATREAVLLMREERSGAARGQLEAKPAKTPKAKAKAPTTSALLDSFLDGPST